MRNLKKQERAAIEAVASRFSATWEEGSGPPDATIVVAGQRVAVDITTLKPRGTSEGKAARLRLRVERVVTGLVERLQASLGETVPDAMTVLLTVTAPIRLPSKNRRRAGSQNTDSPRAGSEEFGGERHEHQPRPPASVTSGPNRHSNNAPAHPAAPTMKTASPDD
jgi:hypothetical protein